MEIQDPSCRAIIVNVRFRLSPMMIDNRGNLIQTFGEALGVPEFGYREDGIDVFSTDQTEHFRISGRDLIGSCEHFTDQDSVVAKLKQFVMLATDELAVEHISFLGIRTFWIAPTDNFEDLCTHLVDRLGGGVGPIADVAGNRPTDVGWVFEFHATDPKLTFRFGPMDIPQATRIFRTEDADLYPPSFLFFDVDRTIGEEPFERGELGERFDRAVEHNLRVSDKLASYLVSGSG